MCKTMRPNRPNQLIVKHFRFGLKLFMLLSSHWFKTLYVAK